MLLNAVRLQPGEALFLGAGHPARLSGLGVEIMANSDNVLRCGLTPKHVDVPELLRIVRFEAGDAGVLRPEAALDGEEVYETLIDEFRLGSASSRRAPPPTTSPARPRRSCSARRSRPRRGARTDAGPLRLRTGGRKAEVSGAGTVFRATVVA